MSDGPHRSDPVQQPPPPIEDLAAFPEVTNATGPLFRAHRHYPDSPDNGCWFFTSHPAEGPPNGRFDLPEPDGTCYFGETPGVALRERYHWAVVARMPLPETVLEDKLSRFGGFDVGEARIADATHADAVNFGVTGELSAGNAYEVTASWAVALRAAGRTGIRYRARFTTGDDRASALFHESGSHPGFAPVTDVPIEDAVSEAGLRLTAIPAGASVAADGALDDDAEPEGD